MAVTKAAAAEAAVATAQAAMEVVRLTEPPNFAKENYAAIMIQTAFRGYLVKISNQNPRIPTPPILLFQEMAF